MEIIDKRTHIISTAEKLFATRGFSGTSVRDIAREAKVNIAMISYYFGSKEKLMEVVFEKRTMNMRLQVEALLQNEELTPLQKVNMLIENYVERVMEQPEFHTILLKEQMVEKNSVIAGIIYETKKRNHELITRLIEDGQRKKAFRKNIDVVLMLNTMVGAVMQTVTSQAQYREENNMQEMPDAEFKKHLKKKLSIHLKILFKAILTYEI